MKTINVNITKLNFTFIEVITFVRPIWAYMYMCAYAILANLLAAKVCRVDLRGSK